MTTFHKNKEYYGKPGWASATVQAEISDGLALLNVMRLKNRLSRSLDRIESRCVVSTTRM